MVEIAVEWGGPAEGSSKSDCCLLRSYFLLARAGQNKMAGFEILCLGALVRADKGMRNSPYVSRASGKDLIL